MTKNPKKNRSRIKINCIRPALEGVYITVTCQSCNATFDSFLATIAGLGFSRIKCPACANLSEVLPNDFLRAMEQFLPEKNSELCLEINKEANQIAESWYRTRPFEKLLVYRGINLGEPTERALFPSISLGLCLNDSNFQKR